MVKSLDEDLRELLEITLEKVREMELKLGRMENDRRVDPRPTGRADISIASTHGEARLFARSITDRSGPGGTGCP